MGDGSEAQQKKYEELSLYGAIDQSMIGRSPVRLLALTIVIIGTAEFLVMCALSLLPPLPDWVDNIADAILLVTILFPILYFFIFRPFIVHVDKGLQREARLRDSEARLRLIVDAAVDAIVRIDASGCIIGWNDQAETIFGWTAADVLGRRLGDVIVPPGDRENHEQGVRRFLDTGKAKILNRRIEATALHRSGREFPVELAVTRVNTADGVVFCGFIRDITERRLTQDTLLLAAKVFENSGEGITITDVNNTIVSVNRSFSEITGYDEVEMIGQNPRVLQSGHHDKAYYQAMWQSVLETGRWQGEIWNRRKTGEIYPEWLSIVCCHNERGDVVNYIAPFSDITTRKAKAVTVERMAYHDHLTGLPNRALLNDRLDQALANARRHQRLLAVLFLDLDRFKAINDAAGHHVGDGLLTAVALRLKACVREEDTVSRLGGDEFVILLSNLSETGVVQAIAHKIVEAVSQPFEIDGRVIYIGTSVGISLFPDGGDSAAALLKAADTAMYQAKQEGRSSYCFFTVGEHGSSSPLSHTKARCRPLAPTSHSGPN